MTTAAFASRAARTPAAPGGYQPGICNIGPAEIARRRRAGHAGLLVTLGVLAGLLVLDLPHPARLIVILPAAGAASGYLQAWLKFCAGVRIAGNFNFRRPRASIDPPHAR